MWRSLAYLLRQQVAANDIIVCADDTSWMMPSSMSGGVVVTCADAEGKHFEHCL